MTKIYLLLISLVIFGCAKTPTTTIEVYKLEKYNDSEVPVCINYKQNVKVLKDAYFGTDVCGNTSYVPMQYEPIKNGCNESNVKVVAYDYCLAQLPKPVHLVTKTKDDMTICYDRNNKVELPILYCQKDMVNIQSITFQ